VGHFEVNEGFFIIFYLLTIYKTYFRLDQLVESSSARMESMKAQQLDFLHRLDSFEHIQRLSRNTLDELKGETDQVFGPRNVRELKHKLRNRKKMKGNILEMSMLCYCIVFVSLVAQSTLKIKFL